MLIGITISPLSREPSEANEVPAPCRTFRLLAVQSRSVSDPVASVGVVEACGVTGDVGSVGIFSVVSIGGVAVAVVSVSASCGRGGSAVFSVGRATISEVAVRFSFGSVAVEGNAPQLVKERLSAIHISMVNFLVFISLSTVSCNVISIVASKNKFVNTEKSAKDKKIFKKVNK